MAEEYEHVYKIILLGDATVGKSHLLCRYIKGNLPIQSKATIGVEFATKTVPLASGGSIKAQIWDTAGQERYRSITSAHYRRAVGALLVYDVTNRISFYNCKKWLNELRASSYDDIVILLIANKIDLINKYNSNEKENVKENVGSQENKDTVQEINDVDVVLMIEGMEFANENNLYFFEASAVTGYNVKEIFEFLIQQIYNLKSRLPSIRDSNTLNTLTNNDFTNKNFNTNLSSKNFTGTENFTGTKNLEKNSRQFGCLEQNCLTNNCIIQ
ncbi:GTP-binding protein, Rab-family, putative [Theileria annulata]|uniref:GTP-binding protein, Rab-family, putative n=1 Tax=Theileria annulata TaxID=5874 RepID=Q4UER6_THEAN|nr:GTP-binding protein, Rab-family, putative [Theileria annulata]CAI74423.1 GTP-binding protein, Rab-family, putative [Theileria annulata]|eukprot:XP_952155.1 GTP-binding protein, Rab-family, putative [Theileria annulata]